MHKIYAEIIFFHPYSTHMLYLFGHQLESCYVFIHIWLFINGIGQGGASGTCSCAQLHLNKTNKESRLSRNMHAAHSSINLNIFLHMNFLNLVYTQTFNVKTLQAFMYNSTKFYVLVCRTWIKNKLFTFHLCEIEHHFPIDLGVLLVHSSSLNYSVAKEYN